jgi:hypothetical protein
MQAPCEKCINRKLGCHSRCAEYLKFAAERDKIRTNRQKQYQQDEYFIKRGLKG